MRPIPPTLRMEIAKDLFMQKCIYERIDAPNHHCRGRITWEHAYIYAGRQINEKWAIVPCCQAHNSGESMVKDYNRYIALTRANLHELQIKYPKKNWKQEYNYLYAKYGGKN